MRKFPGLEAILVQKNSIIPRTIEITFQELLTLSDNGKIPLTPEVLNSKYKVLADFISKEMNFKLDITDCNYTLAMAFCYYWNEANVLTDAIQPGRKDYKEILTFLKKKEGWLDLKNVRCEGYFSNQPALIVLDFNQLVSKLKMTCRELTAVLLHELGHCWSFMEYSDRMQAVNQVLAEALNSDIKDKKEKNKYILKLAAEHEIITKAEYEEMLKSADRHVTSLFVFQMFTKKIINLTNSSYVVTTNEALADNFATKFGYGREVVTALYKMHHIMPTSQYRSDGQFLAFMNSLSEAALLLGLLGVIALFPYAIAAASSSLVTAWVGFFIMEVAGGIGHIVIPGAGIDRDPHYDTAKRRFTRIKNAIVNDLKHERDPKYLKQYMEQIEEIETYIAKAYEHKTLWKWLSLTFSQSARTEDMQMREEQMLEDLIANDLYLASVKLKLKYA